MFGIIGELSFIGGIILNLWAFLSPTPWHSNDVQNSMLYFTPYNEPVGYVAPNPCGSSPLSNSTVSITYGAPTNSVNYSHVAVWMGPLGQYLLSTCYGSLILNSIHKGSCSRDEDGAVHCTKPSYSNPQFSKMPFRKQKFSHLRAKLFCHKDMTYVQPNSVFYPQNMPGVRLLSVLPGHPPLFIPISMKH